MSDTAVHTPATDDIEARLRRNVRILLAAERTKKDGMKAVDLYGPLGVSRQVWSSRLTGGTHFTVPEVVTLGELLDVTVEKLCGPSELVLEGQKFSLKMATDLQGIPCEGDTTEPVRGHLALAPPID